MMPLDVLIQILPQVVLSGLAMGLVYALIAVGLNLIFGLMDLVNFAHGEYMMLAMYIAFWMWALVGVDPLIALPLCAAVLFLIGVGTYWGIIKRILAAPQLAQIAVTFGLLVFFRSLAQLLWTPDFRTVVNPVLSGTIQIAGLSTGTGKLAAGVGAGISPPDSALEAHAPGDRAPSHSRRSLCSTTDGNQH